MRYVPFYLWRKRRQLIPWEIWLTTKLILLLFSKSVLSTSEPQLRIIYLYMCVHDLQWCVASGAPIVWNGDSPAGIRVMNGGVLRLTGEANVKREEEFEREGWRDLCLFNENSTIPPIPFHLSLKARRGWMLEVIRRGLSVLCLPSSCSCSSDPRLKLLLRPRAPRAGP